MNEQQTMIPIEKHELLAKVKEMLESGYRLVQIGCTRLENNELTYAFDKHYKFIYFKIIVPPAAAELPSISPIYWSAFLYENEIHDLYGIKFTDLAIDFHGNFYRTAQENAFAYCERVGGAAKPAAAATASQTTSSSEGSDK